MPHALGLGEEVAVPGAVAGLEADDRGGLRWGLVLVVLHDEEALGAVRVDCVDAHGRHGCGYPDFQRAFRGWLKAGQLVEGGLYPRSQPLRAQGSPVPAQRLGQERVVCRVEQEYPDPPAVQQRLPHVLAGGTLYGPRHRYPDQQQVSRRRALLNEVRGELCREHGKRVSPPRVRNGRDLAAGPDLGKRQYGEQREDHRRQVRDTSDPGYPQDREYERRRSQDVQVQVLVFEDLRCEPDDPVRLLHVLNGDIARNYRATRAVIPAAVPWSMSSRAAASSWPRLHLQGAGLAGQADEPGEREPLSIGEHGLDRGGGG